MKHVFYCVECDTVYETDIEVVVNSDLDIVTEHYFAHKCENCGNWAEEIDIEIMDDIRLLNQHELYTKYSCEGHRRYLRTDDVYCIERPYIVFVDYIDLINVVAKTPLPDGWSIMMTPIPYGDDLNCIEFNFDDELFNKCIDDEEYFESVKSSYLQSLHKWVKEITDVIDKT